jgi:site-specific DNA recombinase
MQELQPVAGYFRVSQARDDMRAPELYRDEIERYCAYRGLELAEIFSDIDHSAYRGAKARPALEQLKARRYEFSGVVVPKLARFGRSVRDLVVLFELFDRDGIALTFLDMNLETSTSQGRLLRHILVAFAEYESDVKSDYARATQRMLATEGRPHGPLAPYGYTVVGKRRAKSYLVDPARAPIVREIFERYVAGYSLSRLARELNARGLKGVKDGVWSRQRLKTMLDNCAYAGLRR